MPVPKQERRCLPYSQLLAYFLLCVTMAMYWWFATWSEVGSCKFLFSLEPYSKLNLFQKIGKALKTCAEAIHCALNDYNGAVAQLNPPWVGAGNQCCDSWWLQCSAWYLNGYLVTSLGSTGTLWSNEPALWHCLCMRRDWTTQHQDLSSPDFHDWQSHWLLPCCHIKFSQESFSCTSTLVQMGSITLISTQPLHEGSD